MGDLAPSSMHVIVLAAVVAVALFGAFILSPSRRRFLSLRRGPVPDPFEPEREAEALSAVEPGAEAPKEVPGRPHHAEHSGHRMPAHVEHKAAPIHRSG